MTTQRTAPPPTTSRTDAQPNGSRRKVAAVASFELNSHERRGQAVVCRLAKAPGSSWAQRLFSKAGVHASPPPALRGHSAMRGTGGRNRAASARGKRVALALLDARCSRLS